jgi:hypothetical protein
VFWKTRTPQTGTESLCRHRKAKAGDHDQRHRERRLRCSPFFRVWGGLSLAPSLPWDLGDAHHQQPTMQASAVVPRFVPVLTAQVPCRRLFALLPFFSRLHLPAHTPMPSAELRRGWASSNGLAKAPLTLSLRATCRDCQPTTAWLGTSTIEVPHLQLTPGPGARKSTTIAAG